MFSTKIAVLLRDDLAPWQALNVTAFLAGGLAAAAPELIGQPYEDAGGTKYLAILRQPVLVFAGDAAVMAAAHRRALERGLIPAIYTAEMFGTFNDADNRAAVRAASVLDLVGIAVHGPKSLVDKVLKGARLHA
jgi:hypothetical protein